MKDHIIELLNEKSDLIDEMENIEKELEIAGLSMDKVCRIAREKRLEDIEIRCYEIEDELDIEMF